MCNATHELRERVELLDVVKPLLGLGKRQLGFFLPDEGCLQRRDQIADDQAGHAHAQDQHDEKPGALVMTHRQRLELQVRRNGVQPAELIDGRAKRLD